MSINAGRLALFALISAVESDLRDIIRHQVAPGLEGDLLPDRTRQQALERWQRETSDAHDVTDEHLLYYVDFGDLFQFVNRHRSELPTRLATRVRESTAGFEALAKVRNRIAHNRPLGVADLPDSLDFTEALARGHSGYWRNLSSTLGRLREEPSFVLTLDPSSMLVDDPVQHNLPLPDFDDTGFIGRENARENLKRRILGPYPVISILAEGGYGKTAFALQSAYDLLDDGNLPFDAVVWVTSKTTRLTPTEIRQISGAIADSVGLIENLAGELAGGSSSGTMDEVLEYMREFNILLFLDNLETVLDERIRHFLDELPHGTKVVITSRTGIGAFENPMSLGPLDESESVELLRTAARVEGLEFLTQMSHRRLGGYCNRMHHNPGFIKWFVSAVRVGQRPEDVLSQGADLLLDFCLSNVYEHLTDDARRIARAFQAVPGERSQGELLFLLDELNVSRLKRGISDLLSANMLKLRSTPVGTTYETKYELSDLSRDYLRRHHPVGADVLRSLGQRRDELISLEESAQSEGERYLFTQVQLRSRGDVPVAKYLREAIDAIYRENYGHAHSLLGRSRELAGEYFEVHRIEGFLAAEQGDLRSARESYQAATQLAPDEPALRAWYAGYLFRYEKDAEAAISEMRIAHQLDPQSAFVASELARLYVATERWTEAIDTLSGVDERDLAGREARKYHDLRLQIPLRRAYVCLERADFDAVREHLEQVQDIFDSVPHQHRDVKLRERLQKGAQLAEVARSRSSISRVNEQLTKLSKTLTRLSALNADLPRDSERVEGVVTKIFTERNFGFIRLGNGEEAFFHKGSLVNPYLWPAVESGHRVSFILTDTKKGIAAQGLQLES